MAVFIEQGYTTESGDFVSQKIFYFSGVNNISDRHSATNIKINSPGKSSEDSVALNLSGIQRFISFEFKLIDDGTDHSGGENIKTIDEQYNYLKNVILSGKTDVQFRININGLIVTTCLIDDLSLNPTFENPNYYKGSIQLTDGKNPLSIITS